MRPESKRNRDVNFTPKYRHFHPQATLFMRNPFDEDIVFQVADEHNVPYDYRLPAHKICELPGGMVATLGLKAIVDKLIGDAGTDLVRIWDPSVRKEYEGKVIVRVREAPQQAAGGVGGEVNLATTEEEIAERDEMPVVAAEEAFPGAKRDRAEDSGPADLPAPPPSGRITKPSTPLRAGNAKGRDPELAATAAASVGNKAQVIEED
jgi:hypothetical protein